VKGFIIIDYIPRFQEALNELQQWVANGDLQWKEHIIDGIDNALDGLSLLFSGGNDGKLMVRLSDES
jgi:NADPH-dependent curcumin reductase CurA